MDKAACFSVPLQGGTRERKTLRVKNKQIKKSTELSIKEEILNNMWIPKNRYSEI